MKKLIAILLALPLLASCSFESPFPSLNSQIEGFAYSVPSASLGDADAEKALEAVIISDSKWVGKKGDKRNFQVQLMGDKYGGSADALEIYYFQGGSVQFLSPTSCTITVKGKFTFLDGTWDIKSENNGDNITLTGSGKTVSLKFWKENTGK
ncbi:MAG: hypothetical protein IKX67_03550 [Bacteroidales bacterium]|nr:hypothetical protein [Bacteroidales bacterium]